MHIGELTLFKRTFLDYEKRRDDASRRIVIF